MEAKLTLNSSRYTVVAIGLAYSNACDTRILALRKKVTSSLSCIVLNKSWILQNRILAVWLNYWWSSLYYLVLLLLTFVVLLFHLFDRKNLTRSWDSNPMTVHLYTISATFNRFSSFSLNWTETHVVELLNVRICT